MSKHSCSFHCLKNKIFLNIIIRILNIERSKKSTILLPCGQSSKRSIFDLSSLSIFEFNVIRIGSSARYRNLIIKKIGSVQETSLYSFLFPINTVLSQECRTYPLTLRLIDSLIFSIDAFVHEHSSYYYRNFAGWNCLYVFFIFLNLIFLYFLFQRMNSTLIWI